MIENGMDKMKVINLIPLGTNQVSFYLALEEYLLSTIDEDIFFLWDIPSSIVIGRNQLMQSEVNVPYVKAHNIPVYRRPSGGGAIYADNNCFMYSYLSKERNKDVLYQVFLNKLSDALKELAIEVVFSGRNDLLFNGKKFSGTAILQTQNGSILHGTFLYDTDLKVLVEALTVDQEKIQSKGIKSVYERVINLKPYLSLSKSELMVYLNNYFKTSVYELSADEVNLVKAIELKYLAKEWIEGNNPPFTLRKKLRFSYGMIESFLDIKKGKIISFQLKGDFFEKKSINHLCNLFLNQNYDVKVFENILTKSPFSDFIEGAKNEDLLLLIMEDT